MKRKFLFFGIFLVLILIAGCSASTGTKDNSIFSEIIIDGDYTHIKDLEADMSVNQVLSALGFTEDDVEINTFESDAIPEVTEHTHMMSKEAFHYTELDPEYGFQKVFIFYDNKLKTVGYRCIYDGIDPSEAYDSAISFMDLFIEHTGATPVENAESFEYHLYGSPEKESFLEPDAYYHCQFFNGGPLAEIAMSTRDTSEMQHMYKDDLTVHLAISFKMEWSA